VASCAQIDSLLQAHIDGELAASETVILEQHLLECRSCAALIRRQKASSALLFEAFSEHRLRDDLTPGIMAHLPEMEYTPQAGREVTYRTKHPKKRLAFFFAFAPMWAASLLLVLGLAIALSWPRNDSLNGSKVGMVTYVRGEILSSGDQSTERHAVALRNLITRNERVETAGEAAAVIGLAGPTQLKMDENTRVKIMDARQMNVETGRIWLSVAKDRRLFRVTTPLGTVTVFGTKFSVEVTPETTVVTVEQGEVTVENATRFVVLKPNERVVVESNSKALSPVSVDAKSLMAWAGDIMPETYAERAFASAIQPEQPGKIPAMQVFVVPTWTRPIQSITFAWQPDSKAEARAGYDIYVSDDLMNPLFRGHIDARVFADPAHSQFEMVIPPDVSVTEVTILHIDVVPDHTTGRLDTPFTEVFALSN
jgi:hypothetical protein